jgi:hypothetical protein
MIAAALSFLGAWFVVSLAVLAAWSLGRMQTATPDPAKAAADRLVDLGWDGFLRRRRAPEQWAMRLAEIGLCTSISHSPGEREWRLRLSAMGRRVRDALPATTD